MAEEKDARQVITLECTEVERWVCPFSLFNHEEQEEYTKTFGIRKYNPFVNEHTL